MKTIKTKFTLTAMAVAFAGMSSLFADTILFNDTVQNGGLFGNGGTIVVDNTLPYPDTGNSDTIKWVPGGDYKTGGLEFYGGKALTVPSGVTNLEYSFYVDVAGSWYMNGFTANLDTGSFNTGTDSWTLDGSAGATGNITGQTWHTINVDLTSVTGFVAGTSVLNGLVGVKNNTDQTSTVFIGDIRLTTIPEPSSVVLLMVAGGTLLFFRRKK